MKKGKKDIIIVVCILGLALVLFLVYRVIFQDRGETYGEIIVDGEVVEIVDLTVDRTFSVAQRPNIVFEVRDSALAFIQSDCPDQICIHSGYQSHTGQSAACLPNRTSLVIRSENLNANEPDLVVRNELQNIHTEF